MDVSLIGLQAVPNISINQSRRYDIRLRKRDEKKLLKSGALPYLFFYSYKDDEYKNSVPQVAEMFWMVPCNTLDRKILLPFAYFGEGSRLVCMHSIVRGLGPYEDIFRDDKRFGIQDLRYCRFHITYRTVSRDWETNKKINPYEAPDRVELVLPSDRWVHKFRKIRLFFRKFKLHLLTKRGRKQEKLYKLLQRSAVISLVKSIPEDSIDE